MSSRPPGWYSDASVPGHQRWWDGGTWSHVTRPTPGAPPSAPPPPAGEPWAGRTGPQPPGAPVRYSATLAPMVTTPDGARLAGAGARLLARLLDGLLQEAVTLALAWPFLGGLSEGFHSYLDKVNAAVAGKGPQPGMFDIYSEPGIASALGPLLAIQLAVGAAYCITFVALRGATLGKLVAGVRVRPWLSDEPPGWSLAARRWVTTDLVGAVVPVYQLIDALWLLWDPRRQCLHDKWPGTVVVRSRR